MEGSGVGLGEGGEAFGGSKEIAAEEKFADFVPVDLAGVEAESDPSARTDVGGQIVTLGLSSGQGGIFSWKNFAGDGNNAVAVVVMQEVSESSFAHKKGSVGAMEFALGFGKSESKLGQSGKSRIGSRSFSQVDRPGRKNRGGVGYPRAFWMNSKRKDLGILHFIND